VYRTVSFPVNYRAKARETGSTVLENEAGMEMQFVRRLWNPIFRRTITIMFHQDENDLGSSESQPPSRGRVTLPGEGNAVHNRSIPVTEEVSAPPM